MSENQKLDIWILLQISVLRHSLYFIPFEYRSKQWSQDSSMG